MSLDCIHSILTQTMVALLIIEEQIGSPQAIHLHVLQLPKDWVILQYVHYHSCIPGGHGRPGQSAIVTSNIMAYSSTGGSVIPCPTSASVSDNPCMENLGVPSSSVYSPCSSGEYISRVLVPVGVHHRCTTAINSNL